LSYTDATLVPLTLSAVERLGMVVADTEKDAIREAIKEFKIEPVRQNRIVVTKLDTRDT
jgi:hypothetical protein